MSSRDYLQAHPFLRIAVALAMGMAVADVVWNAVPPVFWLACIPFSVLLSLLCRRLDIKGLFLFLAVFCLGGWLMTMSLSDVRRPLPEGEQRFEAVVMSQPVVHGRVVMCDLLVADGPLAGRRLRASIFRDTIESRYASLRVGSGFVARSRLESNASQPTANGSYARWLEAHGYVARTFIYHTNWQKRRVKLDKVSAVDRLRLSALLTRGRLTQTLRSSGLSEESYALVSAMSLGDKSALDKSTRGLFQQTGASHVLALSGLHLGILYCFFSLVVRSLRRRVTTQLLLVAAIWSYAFLTGLPVSLLRAATMLTIYAFVDVSGRQRLSLNTLALAAVILLVANPLVLFDAGFQMSVMSVLGIMVFYRPLYNVVGRKYLIAHREVEWIWSMAVVSVAAQLGVAPLVAHYFGYFPVYFILTNFVAVPLTTLILLSSLLLLLFSGIPFLADGLVDCVGWLTRLLMRGLDVLSTFPMASIADVRLNGVQTFGCYLLTACVAGLIYYMLKIRRVRGRLAVSR